MRGVSAMAMSGMSVATARLARSAYNVANLNTPGFVAAREIPQEAPEGGVRSYPTPLGESFRAHNYQGQSEGSNTDLTLETIEQISAVQAFRANVAMLQADDERQGSLLDLRI
jgi:flagellar basal body rod protein FlgG